MLTFKFTGAGGVNATPEVLTSGMVGKQAKFVFSPEWDELEKTAVFTSGAVSRAVVNIGDTVTIPWEVLEVPGNYLYVGAYGVDAAGKVIIPTIMVRGPKIHRGAQPGDDPSLDPSLPIWKALQDAVGNLDDLQTEEKESLVAAVNELRKAGATTEQIAKAVTEYLTENPIKETDPTVPDWAKQPQKPTYTADEVGALPADTVIPEAYTLTQATDDTLGGIYADPAEETDTQPVRIGADGKLVTKPGGGSLGSSEPEVIWETVLTEEVASVSSGTYSRADFIALFGKYSRIEIHTKNVGTADETITSKGTGNYGIQSQTWYQKCIGMFSKGNGSAANFTPAYGGEPHYYFAKMWMREECVLFTAITGYYDSFSGARYTDEAFGYVKFLWTTSTVFGIGSTFRVLGYK